MLIRVDYRCKGSHIEKIGDVNSDNAFCFNVLKNRLSELERQIIEKDAIISFLSNQVVNKNLNGDSRVNEAVNSHNNSFQKRELIIVLIMISVWSNIIIVIIKKKKVKTSS